MRPEHTRFETARPVSAAKGAERGTLDLADVARPPDEAARERIAAAQRAYIHAVKAAGLNPMANPVP